MPDLKHAEQMAAPRHVVIIGGGITGLSAAWYVQRLAEAGGIPIRCTVLEAGSRWGGKVMTERVALHDEMNFVVEAGPDSFLTQKPWALTLARELGLNTRLLGTNDHQRTIYVLRQGTPVPMPEGLLLIVPTRFWPFIKSPLISPLGKLRMALDLVIPARRGDDDETLGAFIRRRLGSEALDRIAEPLMAGIYNADAEQQSLLATFPRFRQLEQSHGSLIRGILATRRKQPSSSADIPASLFMTFEGGTQELIDALADQVKADLHLGSRVTAITRDETVSGYRILLDDGSRLEADAVIITVPAQPAATLLRALAPAAADELAQIRSVSTGTITLAYRKVDIQRPLDGFGMVIPTSEKRPINAITVSSTKFDYRAPENFVLLRVFFGGTRSPQTMQMDDADLLVLVRDQLHDLMGITADPLFHRVFRWHDANPQYDLHHLDLVARIETALPDGLFVAGSAYRGVGLPDCVHQAQNAAAHAVQYLTDKQPTTRERV